MPTLDPPNTPPQASSAPSGRPPFMERVFPTVMKYSGLLLAFYEGVVDRPPQGLVIALAAAMMGLGQLTDSVFAFLRSRP